MSKVRFVELKELGVDVDTFDKIYRMGEEDGRADAIAELKPFFDSLAENPLDWICDDMCGEYENCITDETWCAEHCKDGMDYECVKKWCELKEQTE